MQFVFLDNVLDATVNAMINEVVVFNGMIQVLEFDDANVTVLCQRALLYESMEKYRLGAQDLRTVLKIDPVNRLARSTIHRLNKMAD